MTNLLFPIEPPDHDHLTVDEMFDQWWRQYPRKVDKGSARKAFKRVLAKKIASFDELMQGVMRYSAERMGEDPVFTKHPATWLTAESWGNEPLIRPPKPLSTADSMMVGLLSGLSEDDAMAVVERMSQARPVRR